MLWDTSETAGLSAHCEDIDEKEQPWLILVRWAIPRAIRVAWT